MQIQTECWVKEKNNLEVCFFTDLEGGGGEPGDNQYIDNPSHIQEIEVQYPPTYFFSQTTAKSQ